MLFNSYFFLFVFLPTTLLGFHLLSRFHRPAAIVWLTLASLAYYAWWNPDPSSPWSPYYLGLILASCVSNYLFGWTIHKVRSSITKRGLLIASVSGNLLLLGYYKYSGLFLNWGLLLDGQAANVPHLVLPLAVSFFTFVQITFLVDSYRGKVTSYHFGDYLLFVTFFPHLIAGPIVHHSQLMPQFRRQAVELGWRHFLVGFVLLALGMFKKVVIADALAGTATPLFDLAAGGSRSLTFMEAWVATVAYTFQIYFDFSGYSDMAIGISYMFGIRLPLNFNSPYKAASVAEFWQRWHITLSRFLRDYLYIPLGGNRRGRVRRYVNLMATMLLGGIWHGAGLTYLLWGALHGAFLCVNHAWVGLVERRGWRPLPRPVGVVMTFFVVMLAWVPFRAGVFETTSGGSMTKAWDVTKGIYSSMFGGADIMGWPGRVEQVMKQSRALRPVILALLVVWTLPNTQEFLGRFSPHYREGKTVTRAMPWWRWRPTWLWTLIIVALCFWIGHEFDKVSEFIYFQF